MSPGECGQQAIQRGGEAIPSEQKQSKGRRQERAVGETRITTAPLSTLITISIIVVLELWKVPGTGSGQPNVGITVSSIQNAERNEGGGGKQAAESLG